MPGMTRRNGLRGLAAAVACICVPNQANAKLSALADAIRRASRLPPGALVPPSGDGGPSVSFTPTESEKIRIPINTSAAGDNTIIAGSSGYRLCIYELLLWNVTAQNLTLKDSMDADPLCGVLTSFPDATGLFLNETGEPHFMLKDGGNFVLNLSAATQVTGYVRFSVKPA